MTAYQDCIDLVRSLAIRIVLYSLIVELLQAFDELVVDLQRLRIRSRIRLGEDSPVAIAVSGHRRVRE